MEVSPIIAGHVVAMSYPGRGHINAMMNLCKLLVSKNSYILITFVVTEEWLGLIGSDRKPDNIQFGSIPNVIQSEVGRAKDLMGFVDDVMTKMEAPFERLLDRLEPPPTIIIYDTLLFWVVGVGNARQIPVASFWPMPASFFSVFQHYYLFEENGDYPINVLEKGEKRVDYIPGISSTRLADIVFIDGSWACCRMLQWVLKGFQSVLKAQYLLFASVYELEPQAVDILKSELSLPIYTIGPAIPYFSLKQNPSLRTNTTSPSYLDWLDKQPPSSVLYISQGSFLSVSRAQIDEIAAGLRESGIRFLWVARGEASRLKEICGDKGIILTWCDQLRVLLHPAVGGFWTHCGWNSVREGLFAGVPFLTFPIVMDQPLNSKMIVEDWNVGWRVKEGVDAESMVSKDEIASLLKRFMDLDCDVVRDMRERARMLKKKCHLSITNDGSSETNVNAFLKDITQASIISETISRPT